MTRQEKTIVNTSFLPTSAGTQEVSAELRDTAEQETARARERWGRGRGGSVSVCLCVRMTNQVSRIFMGLFCR